MTSGTYKYSAPLFVKELYNSEKITAPVFAFYLSGVHETSYLDIGYIDQSAMKNSLAVNWIDVIENDFWWTSKISSVKFTSYQGNPLPFKEKFSNEKVMTDTGTSCTYFPTRHYRGIISALTTLVPHLYIDSFGDFGIDCDMREKLPTIEFLIDGYWYEMPSYDYVIETDGDCWLCLGENPIDNYWVLGDTFLRGYYSMHAYDGNKAKFALTPHRTSKKQMPYKGLASETGFNKKKLIRVA